MVRRESQTSNQQVSYLAAKCCSRDGAVVLSILHSLSELSVHLSFVGVLLFAPFPIPSRVPSFRSQSVRPYQSLCPSAGRAANMSSSSSQPSGTQPTQSTSSSASPAAATAASAVPVSSGPSPSSSDSLSSVDDYSQLDTLSKAVYPRVHSASRYRRIDGEPSLAFFRRERNSLSAYCRPSSAQQSELGPEVGGDDGAGAMAGGVDDDWDEALARLEKRAVMSGAVRDEAAKGGYLGNDIRYEVRNQRVQRQRRQSIKQQRAARLMQTLKFLLTMKGR